MSRLYLESFTLPQSVESYQFPYNIFFRNQLHRIDFEPITILYGNNGCGKSTVLNIIARKLDIAMKNIGNDSRLIQGLIDKCSYSPRFQQNTIPPESKFIRSEDVMHNIVKCRQRNEHIKKLMKEQAPNMYEYFFTASPNAKHRELVWAGERFWAGKMLEFEDSESNGELAMKYFNDNIDIESLTMLDEPENSLSPMLQEELAETIQKYTRYFKCQFIIATHSPFILAIPGAKIYNLNHTPADISRFHELESTKTYKRLFDNPNI